METATRFPVRDYDLAATLTSGQAFRWVLRHDGWEAVVQARWIRLSQPRPDVIEAVVRQPQQDWNWLVHYLQLQADHMAMLGTFPTDEPLRRALAHCRGLRLLRQDPWECLASFILSSTKQITQIQQCIEFLCQRFGAPVDQNDTLPARRSGSSISSPTAHFSFPTPERLATATEAELRACKIGFRAKYLQATARMIAEGELDLAGLPSLPLDTARNALMQCPGVGRKIADCTLLFSCGFDRAFPIDVWVERALQRLYFPRRRAKRRRLEHFAATHFGPYAGLAQQYLFHYLRTGGHGPPP